MPSYMMEGSALPLVLDLDFAGDKSLAAAVGPTPSFSRASKGWAFNASGTLTEHAINAPRFDHVYDGATWVSRGLLIEEQRTNLCLQSSVNNDTWSSVAATLTPSAITAPDGTNSGALLVGNAGTANHFHRQVATIGAGTYTVSVYAKAKEIYIVALGSVATGSKFFNLQSGTVGGNAGGSPASASITPVGNGWYRLTVTGPAYAGGTGDQIQLINTNNTEAVFHNADGTSGAYFWGAQIELGAFPTSYIPTVASSVIRSADVCQITGTDFSGIWNATEGSFAVEARCQASGTAGFLSANNNASAERIELYSSGTDPKMIVVDGGATQADIDAGAIVANTNFKLASRYKVNDFAISDDGAAVVTDTSGTIPTPTQLDIGKNQAGNYTNGHIGRVRYYNAALANALLERLST